MIGLPWWLSGKESTYQYKRHRFDLWSGKIPHATEHKAKRHNFWDCALEPGSRKYWAHVPKLLRPEHPRDHALQQEKPLQWEAQASQSESSFCSPQLEKAHTAAKTQHSW